jgi:cyclase
MKTFVSLVLLAPCIVLLCAAGATGAQEPAELPFTLKQVGPNAWAAIDNPKAKERASANAGFVIGDDGVVVVDTTARSEAARQLLMEIRKLTKLPVKFVINTHYHADHVAGNGIFADAGAVVLAQSNVRGWIHTRSLKFFGKEAPAGARAFIEALVPPTVVYDQAMDLYLGSRRIHVRGFPGHTGGDSVVMIPDAKTIFGGDLFWRNTLPNMIDASTTPWIDTLDALAKNGAGYTFVPGHGDAGSAQDVAAFREYLATLQKLVADARAQKKAGDALAETVMTTLKDTYGQWDFFEFFAKPNILDMDAELSGKKTIPRAQPAK